MITVSQIPAKEAEPWILLKHYAKRIPCVCFAFGAFDNGELVGICTYGIPASPYLCFGVCGYQYKDIVLELNRLCCDSRKNLASTLVAKSLSLLPKPKIIVSYADCGQGHVGYIYQATNFLFTGTTKERTDIYSESGHSRHSQSDWTKRQPRSSKHRYVYFCGDRRQKLQMSQALKYPIEAYPKGESKRYDASPKVEIQMVMSI